MSGDLRSIIQQRLSNGPIGSFDVPEWNKTIYVFKLTLSQRMAYRKEADEEQMLARLIQVRAKDAEGNYLFNEADMDAMLKLEDAELVGRVADKILEFDKALKLSEEDEKKS